jgi:hypothetical protein
VLLIPFVACRLAERPELDELAASCAWQVEAHAEAVAEQAILSLQPSQVPNQLTPGAPQHEEGNRESIPTKPPLWRLTADRQYVQTAAAETDVTAAGTGACRSQERASDRMRSVTAAGPATPPRAGGPSIAGDEINNPTEPSLFTSLRVYSFQQIKRGARAALSIVTAFA